MGIGDITIASTRAVIIIITAVTIPDTVRIGGITTSRTIEVITTNVPIGAIATGTGIVIE